MRTVVRAVLVAGLVAGVAGVALLVQAGYERRANEKEIVATMRSDPIWDFRLDGSTVEYTDHVEGCEGTSSVASRTSRRQSYRLHAGTTSEEFVQRFGEAAVAAGWAPYSRAEWLAPVAWSKPVDGRSYGIELRQPTDRQIVVELISPQRMCLTNFPWW